MPTRLAGSAAEIVTWWGLRGDRQVCGFAGFAQRFDGLWQCELFTLEAGDEAAAADDAAGFEAAQHAEKLAPAGHGGFALHEIAEDDAVAPEEDEGRGFGLLFSLLACGDGACGATAVPPFSLRLTVWESAGGGGARRLQRPAVLRAR